MTVKGTTEHQEQARVRPYCAHCKNTGWFVGLERPCKWCNPGGEFRALLASTAQSFPVAPQEDALIRREIRSSRHPHFTHEDHRRMKEALDSLSDYPTEEEAEAVLQACGTSGKEVVNDFIERLLRENLELKQRLETPAPTPSLPARDGAREIARRCVRSFDESFSYQASHADVLAIIERHAQAIISRYFAAAAAETVGEREDKKEKKNG